MRSREKRDVRWWTKPDSHRALFDHVQRIRTHGSARRRNLVYSACLYDDAEFFGALPVRHGVGPDTALAFNVVRPNVDTCTTQLCKARPLPMPLTRGGDYSQQRRARLMGKFLEGQWIRSKVWETNFQIMRDAVLYGTGFSYSYRVGDSIAYDRVFPWEVDVDPKEALHGKPMSLYLTRIVDRLYLQEMYPDLADEIETSDDRFDDYASPDYTNTSDCVIVIEGWRLPSKPGAKDGAHVIAVSNATLTKEKYVHDSFPIVAMRLMPPSIGYWGQGMGKQLQGIQYTLNVTAQRLQEQAELSPCWLLIPESANIRAETLDNSAWPAMYFSGSQKPEVLQAPPFAQGLFQFARDVYNMSFDQTGVSQVAAQAELPKALREASGVALQLHNENRSERFNVASRLYESFCVENAWLHFRLFEEIAKKFPKFAASTPSREKGMRVLSQVKWKEVAIDRDSFILDVFPTTMLHSDPAMKAAQVESWINAGWISSDEGRMLLEFPDLDRVNSLDRAKYDILESIFERFLDPDMDPEDPKTYIGPEPMFDLKLCIQQGLLHYLRAKLDGTEPERLQLFLDFLLDAQDMMNQANQGMGQPSTPVESGISPPQTTPAQPTPGANGVTPSGLAQMSQS